MDNTARLAIFQSQVVNSRSLLAASTQVRRAINHAIRIGNDPMTVVQTKVMALVFCAWAEANFLKVLHTPYGFTLSEINQIKAAWSKNGIGDGWSKCVQLALRKVPATRGSFVPNARKRLAKVIHEFVIEPSLLRNKIAHGQWIKALNRSNTATNEEMTLRLAQINITTITIWFECHKRVAEIVESLIESPKKFARDYWHQTLELDEFIEKSRTWSVDDLIERLRRKPAKISGTK